MDISEIRRQNPWWENPLRIEEDLKIQDVENSIAKWTPRLLHYIDLEKDALYSIRGPRQVGKTTSIKILIKKLLINKNPINIMYYACDLVLDEKKLYELLESYHIWIRNQNQERIYIFLDEISSVKNWQKTLKFFIDTKGNSNITFLVTGSHTLDIKSSTERLPGRVGDKEGIQTNKILLPMKFAEYVEMRNPEIFEHIKKLDLHKSNTRNDEFLQIISGKLPKSSWNLSKILPELDKLLEEYLITGGIMIAVNDYLKNSKISASIYELYLKQLAGDIGRLNREEKTAKLILLSMMKRMSTPISWDGIRKENGIANSQTIFQYANLLSDLFIINIFYKINLDNQHKKLSDKKIYIQNPFIFHALYNWLINPSKEPFVSTHEFLSDSQQKSTLIESVIANHLCRATFSLKPSDIFDASDHIFYTRTKKGHEIDFVIKVDEKLRGIEVKYQNSINPEDFISLKKLQSGCLITKSLIEQRGRYSLIPISLFLLYI